MIEHFYLLSAPSTPPKPDEIIPVSEEDLASVEAAIKDETKKDRSLRYEVILSPAVKKVNWNLLFKKDQLLIKH